jgi:hypothetical protein
MKNKNAPALLVNLSLIGYIGVLVSSAGYYGYYRPHDDALLIPWILWAALGGCCLGYKNLKSLPIIACLDPTQRHPVSPSEIY